jgi:hypothetical protein
MLTMLDYEIVDKPGRSFNPWGETAIQIRKNSH